LKANAKNVEGGGGIENDRGVSSQSILEKDSVSEKGCKTQKKTEERYAETYEKIDE